MKSSNVDLYKYYGSSYFNNRIRFALDHKCSFLHIKRPSSLLGIYILNLSHLVLKRSFSQLVICNNKPSYRSVFPFKKSSANIILVPHFSTTSGLWKPWSNLDLKKRPDNFDRNFMIKGCYSILNKIINEKPFKGQTQIDSEIAMLD